VARFRLKSHFNAFATMAKGCQAEDGVKSNYKEKVECLEPGLFLQNIMVIAEGLSFSLMSH